MRAVHQDLGLDNGHEAVSLANAGVACKAPGSLADGALRRAVFAYRDDSAPLCEAGAGLVVAGAALVHVGKALRVLFAVRARQPAGALVDLDAENDPVLLEAVDEQRPVVELLEQRLLKEDHTRDEAAEAVGRGQQVAVRAAVLAVIRKVDVLETLPNGANRLIRGQDALSRARDGLLQGWQENASAGSPTGARG